MSDTDKLHSIREAFLDVIADSRDFTIDYDADTNSNGMMVDCSTFSINGPLTSLVGLVEALGMRRKYEESVDDMIQRYVEGESWT